MNTERLDAIQKREAKGAAFWLYFAATAINVIGFVMADFNNDMQDMIFHGFAAALWFRLAEREAKP